MIKKYINSLIDEKVDEKLEHLLSSKKFLNAIGEELDKAEAIRLAKKTEKRLEEMSEREKEMFTSPDPWIDIEAIGEEDGAMKIKIAWNPAFITYLRENGFQGDDEDELVQRYIAMLNINILTEEFDNF